MGSIPVLKPSEVCRILERIGFIAVRQRGSQFNTVMPMGAERPFLCTKGVPSPRRFSAKLLATLV